MRFARRSHLRERPRDSYGHFRKDDHHRWDVSPSYRQFEERGGWDENRPYRQTEELHPTRYQYFGDREDYPGPGRVQGFGRDNERAYYGQRWKESNHQPGAYERYRTNVHDLSDYGYGSGRADFTPRRTWDKRDDESYNWGEHSGDNVRPSGQHRGKGPRGYKRLDERIREEVNDRLCFDDRLDASEIVVSVQDGEVSLSGTVTDKASKRRAEDIVEEISGVSNVENRIRIGKVTPEEPVSPERQRREVGNGKSKALQER
jgi:hypothetical protein